MYLLIPLLTSCVNGYDSSLVNGGRCSRTGSLCYVLILPQDYSFSGYGKPNLAFHMAQYWVIPIYRPHIREGLIILGIITSIQIIGGLVVRYCFNRGLGLP
jgi:hypothetical protein